MDEEIDLRPYIELLIKRWYFIIGAAVLGGLIAYGVTSLQQDVYEATALIAVTQDRLVARFDPRLDTSDEPQPVRILPELATSDDLISELLVTIAPPLEDIDTITSLRKLLEADPGSDPSLIRLMTTHSDPADAARVSNQWAAILVQRANELFGDGDSEQLTFFQEQLSKAEEELSSGQASLIEFQGVNRQTIQKNKVDALNNTQRILLAEKRELNQLQSNIRDFKEQIDRLESHGLPSFAEQLTALVLQLRVFKATLELPLQLQLDGASSLSASSLDEHVTVLAELEETVISRRDEIETELTELEPQLLELQEELQESRAESNRLTLNRDVAQETYLSLARKVDEEKITANDMIRGIRLASEAAVPEKPVRSSRLIPTLIAMVVAAMLMIAGIVAIDWWKEDSE